MLNYTEMQLACLECVEERRLVTWLMISKLTGAVVPRSPVHGVPCAGRT